MAKITEYDLIKISSALSLYTCLFIIDKQGVYNHISRTHIKRYNHENKTVTVIGGAGFIGRSVVEKLAKQGARVVILCRNADKAKMLKPLGDVGQITAVSGDVLRDDVLEKIIAPADGESDWHSCAFR